MNAMTVKPKIFFKTICLFVFTLSLLGCKDNASSTGNENAENAQQVYIDAMKIHDGIMPQMAEANLLKKQLTDKKNSLSADVKGNHEEETAKIDSIMNNLDSADQEMKAWMKNVKTVPNAQGKKSAYSDEMDMSEVTDTTDLINIQREQKQKIERIKERLQENIGAARDFLNLPKTSS